MPTVTATLTLPVPPEETFALHADVRNLARLSPPRRPCAAGARASTPATCRCWRSGRSGRRCAGWRTSRPSSLPGSSPSMNGGAAFRRFRHAHVVVPAGTAVR
ncbi:MAG: hypothetical protein U0531_19410 [Dehalococcoidia bacterium]